jgi:hypothetical protein
LIKFPGRVLVRVFRSDQGLPLRAVRVGSLLILIDKKVAFQTVKRY